MARILIIDDEQTVRDVLRDRIEVMGHEVDEATSVFEALKRMEEPAYDCILLDLGIPKNFEGPTDPNHGQTLLRRIVGLPDAPPVVVITANGLNSHHLVAAVWEIGAKDFIAKPFNDQEVEMKIRKQLEIRCRERSPNGAKKGLHSSGDLVMYDNRIELCGEEVGGMRSNSLIRRILRELARRNSSGCRIPASRKELAKAIGADVTEPSIANAIKDFREKCTMKLGCDPHDVIVTHRGGGYQLSDKITFRVGSEERVHTQAEADQAAILRKLRASGDLTSRAIAERTQIPLFRVDAALAKLDDEDKVFLKGSGANAVYSIRETTS